MTAPLTQDKQTLLPCPFCGESADIEEISDGATCRFSVGCMDNEGDCMGYQSLTTFARRADAIKAWNKRPSPPADMEGAVELMCAGLANRLAHILVADVDRKRFVLSTESAENIVETVKEWLRMGRLNGAITALQRDAGIVENIGSNKRLHAVGDLRRRVDEFWKSRGMKSAIDGVYLKGDGFVRVQWSTPTDDGAYNIPLADLYAAPILADERGAK